MSRARSRHDAPTAYVVGFARSQGFTDGNKRTGLACALVFRVPAQRGVWSGVATAAPHAQDAGLVITPATARPWRVASPKSFTGTVRVQPTFDTTAMTRAYGASVAFEPGARTAWHTHARGQVLIVNSGVGRVQRWEGPVQEIRPGDVVRIPPGVKHWHGAAPASAMTHLAIVEHDDGRSTNWLEQVSDEQYGARAGAAADAQPCAGARQWPDAGGGGRDEHAPRVLRRLA